MEDISIRNARWLAARLHALKGSWVKAAEGTTLDSSSLWKLAQGKTASVTAPVLRALCAAAGEEPSVAISVDLRTLRGEP